MVVPIVRLIRQRRPTLISIPSGVCASALQEVFLVFAPQPNSACARGKSCAPTSGEASDKPGERGRLFLREEVNSIIGDRLTVMKCDHGHERAAAARNGFELMISKGRFNMIF